MFKYFNGKNSKPREKQVKVPQVVRHVIYTTYYPDDKNPEPQVTEGYEIVTEVVVPIGTVITPVVLPMMYSKTVEVTSPNKRKRRARRDYNENKEN